MSMNNNAPEKIWVHELSAKELNVPLKEYHIEYTRTDAFIEKACAWLENNLQGVVGGSICIEDFRRYLEGE